MLRYSPSSLLLPLHKRQTKSRQTGRYWGFTGRTKKASKSYKSMKLTLLFKAIPYETGSISQTKISQQHSARDSQTVTLPAAK